MNEQKNQIITLIGRKQAKIGYAFTFLRPPNKECARCKLFTTCIENLKEGETYEIIAIRKKTHECPVHQDGVQVVLVKELEKIALIESKIAFAGATITFRAPNCEEYSCKFYEKCNSTLDNEKKYKILEIINEETCKLGKKLQLAKFKHIE